MRLEKGCRHLEQWLAREHDPSLAHRPHPTGELQARQRRGGHTLRKEDRAIVTSY
ncbi:hypothetical protein AB0D33_04970 [Streptomyces sp. NPDC048404]|uniref:hypothetical protein n=1 Tax=unclassified Streptomyces TaxID=2593676 RepID=UPI00342BA7E0